MSLQDQLLTWGLLVLICVGVVPLIGGAMLRLTCSVTRVPGVRFGRCWLALPRRLRCRVDRRRPAPVAAAATARGPNFPDGHRVAGRGAAGACPDRSPGARHAAAPHAGRPRDRAGAHRVRHRRTGPARGDPPPRGRSARGAGPAVRPTPRGDGPLYSRNGGSAVPNAGRDLFRRRQTTAQLAGRAAPLPGPTGPVRPVPAGRAVGQPAQPVAGRPDAARLRRGR